MRLEVGAFPVSHVTFGPRTHLNGHELVLNKQEILDMVRQDPYVAQADVRIARPGESVRIIEYENVIEPKLKTEGEGTPYPGVCGRPTEMVGTGRTHRLAGVAVVECLDLTGMIESSPGETRQWNRERVRDVRFIDMSGPGAVHHYASQINICLVVRPIDNLPAQEQHYASFSNALKIADYVAEVTRNLEPPEVEIFDTDPTPGLPGIVYIPHLASSEPVAGAQGSYGSAVYGQTRLSAPWHLSGTEMLDGAVCGGGPGANSGGGATWVMANSPVVLDLWRRHCRELNFRGCIIQRTNWTDQREYVMAADRASRLAVELGAEGAILTTDIRGQRFVGTMLTLKSCERAGIKTVLLTEEEDNENGAAPPFLFVPPEFVAGVSTGTGDMPEPFPAVADVVGTIAPAAAEWFEVQRPVHGRYGIRHLQDYWGFGKQSYADFFAVPGASP